MTESLDVLRGGGPGDVRALTLALATMMLELVGIDVDPATKLDDGSALRVISGHDRRPRGRPGRGAPRRRGPTIRRCTQRRRGPACRRPERRGGGLATRSGSGTQGGPGQRRGGVVMPGARGRTVAKGQPLFEVHADDELHLGAGREAIAARSHRRRRAPSRARGLGARSRLGRRFASLAPMARTALTKDADSPRAQGPAPRPPRRRPATRDGRRTGARDRLQRTADERPRRAPALVHRRHARSDLVRYLEGFAHTLAVMQTKDQLERVAPESAIDLARDGVVYAEVRFAPELHLERRPDPRRGRPRGARRLRAGDEGGRSTRGTHRRAHPALGDAPGGAERDHRRARGRASATRACAASTSPAPRTASPRPSTCAPSTSSSARTFTSRSTPARPSGCRRSGRPCSSATPSGSATACASSTTSTRVGESLRARASRQLRARPPHPARGVPDVQRPHRRRAVHRRAPHRPLEALAFSRHASTPTTA